MGSCKGILTGIYRLLTIKNIKTIKDPKRGVRDCDIINGMKSLLLTLKAWPVVTAATIALCYLTKTVAAWLGFDLPDQQNVHIVAHVLENAFASPRHFLGAAFLVAQIIILAPALEELLFRGLLFKLPIWTTKKIAAHRATCRLVTVATVLAALVSATLFSAAHYLPQPWPDAAFLALFFFGLAQCRLYEKTDRIGCPMLLHALFNLTNLVLLFVIPVE